MSKKTIFFTSIAIFSGGIPLVQADQIPTFTRTKISSNTIESKNFEGETFISKPAITFDKFKCDEFEGTICISGDVYSYRGRCCPQDWI